jgi:DNA-binding transcriptional LysR family regulator
MTLRDMTYMTVIAEEKSITRAAAKLYLAQPALSQCVQKVEKELGSPVFIRGTGGAVSYTHLTLPTTIGV